MDLGESSCHKIILCKNTCSVLRVFNRTQSNVSVSSVWSWYLHSQKLQQSCVTGRFDLSLWKTMSSLCVYSQNTHFMTDIKPHWHCIYTSAYAHSVSSSSERQGTNPADMHLEKKKKLTYCLKSSRYCMEFEVLYLRALKGYGFGEDQFVCSFGHLVLFLWRNPHPWVVQRITLIVKHKFTGGCLDILAASFDTTNGSEEPTCSTTALFEIGRGRQEM